mmetsp:Transcript_78489/g.179615  ORF Transcript_78489/g.179615 Transcript_78489/m.179615 type:complete len:386 (-) Transcript_78489:697-1854(-)
MLGPVANCSNIGLELAQNIAIGSGSTHNCGCTGLVGWKAGGIHPHFEGRAVNDSDHVDPVESVGPRRPDHPGDHHPGLVAPGHQHAGLGLHISTGADGARGELKGGSQGNHNNRPVNRAGAWCHAGHRSRIGTIVIAATGEPRAASQGLSRTVGKRFLHRAHVRLALRVEKSRVSLREPSQRGEILWWPVHADGAFTRTSIAAQHRTRQGECLDRVTGCTTLGPTTEHHVLTGLGGARQAWVSARRVRRVAHHAGQIPEGIYVFDGVDECVAALAANNPQATAAAVRPELGAVGVLCLDPCCQLLARRELSPVQRSWLKGCRRHSRKREGQGLRIHGGVARTPHGRVHSVGPLLSSPQELLGLDQHCRTLHFHSRPRNLNLHHLS